jgi:hypothetical protein
MSLKIKRRELVQKGAGILPMSGLAMLNGGQKKETLFNFNHEDSLVHPDGWESLNPGYWQVKNKALRRRVSNVGDRARAIGFPFHNATHKNKGAYKTEYDASLPKGILYRRDWKMNSEFSLRAEFRYLADRPAAEKENEKNWKMFNDGWGLMGLAFGSDSVFNSYGKKEGLAVTVGWSDAKECFIDPGRRRFNSKKGTNPKVPKLNKVKAPVLKVNDRIQLQVDVLDRGSECLVKASYQFPTETIELEASLPKYYLQGYVGVVGRGLIDFEILNFEVLPNKNPPLEYKEIQCYNCYPLGDTLKSHDGVWSVKFIAMFHQFGQRAELRISDQEYPKGGWANVPVAGHAKIVDHEWRRNTSVITAELPFNPSDKTMYYTVWKDGVDVTADIRIGSATTGEGTGLVGDVPATGSYVGRLPQLVAPYKLCGLSCHAISGGLQMQNAEGHYYHEHKGWHFRDQPSLGSYKYLEDFKFQVMVWEDDVWYMELLLYPPSTDDAYKVVKNSICGPTSRWQMMRHWNIINPGDHDYGMDDIKGPEQLILRKTEGLGQDTAYLKRNFQIVHHLVTGAEEVDPLENPKKWRSWRMPKGDFSFYILDSRLWRSSQDVDIWDDQGWGGFKSLYDRTDPTRSLLGEEQFAWLQEQLQKDASPLICLTGINGMHTVWTPQEQRDRVMADYAGWVKAGSDRVLELLGSRKGVVTVYGDVHNGCIMKNMEHGIIECSFGPIGRMGGRGVIPGFGPKMKDTDGRDLEIYALYHKTYKDMKLQKHEKGDPFYYNFLEMEFDPRTKDPSIGLRVRNMIDSPKNKVRGGGSLETVASKTGRENQCQLPKIKTLARADVYFRLTDGTPVQAIRSRDDGTLPIQGLVDVKPGEKLIMTAYDGKKVDSKQVVTLLI